jgi:hypothetical protein
MRGFVTTGYTSGTVSSTFQTKVQKIVITLDMEISSGLCRLVVKASRSVPLRRNLVILISPPAQGCHAP